MTPKIEAFKKQNDFLHVKDMLPLPEDSPFGNLTLKWFDFMQRFDNINNKIDEIYFHLEKIKQNRTEDFNEFRQVEIAKSYIMHKSLIEELIYWLRKSTDEMISLICVIDYFSNNQEYPKKISVESIGSLLKNKNLRDDFFTNYYDLLKTLNEISNAYKHSFINTDITNYIGNIEPYVFALSLSNNDLKKKPNFHSIELTGFLFKYSEFCESYKMTIKKYERLTS